MINTKRGDKMFNDFLYQNFYDNYLGINKINNYLGTSVCISDFRDTPLNKHYFYKVIATTYKNKHIISCSSNLDEYEIKELCQSLDFNKINSGELQSDIKIRNYELSCMYRLLLDKHDKVDGKNSLVVRMKGSIEFKYLESQRKYLALHNDDLIGYCKISDVILGFGNIVVWIDAPYRRQGIAEHLLDLLIQQCYKDRIFPMYVVKFNNLASITLAKKMGFSIVQKEFVASYYK